MPPLTWRHRIIPLLLGVSGWIVLGITTVSAFQGIRIFAVFAFALIGPGIALIRLLPLKDFLEQAVLAIALGLSLAALTAETAAIARVLQPGLVLMVLASICSAAAIAELLRGAKTPC
jgi:hypothetical protein